MGEQGINTKLDGNREWERPFRRGKFRGGGGNIILGFLGRGMDFGSGYSNADFVNTAIIS